LPNTWKDKAVDKNSAERRPVMASGIKEGDPGQLARVVNGLPHENQQVRKNKSFKI
jgi:hypothetical protein